MRYLVAFGIVIVIAVVWFNIELDRATVHAQAITAGAPFDAGKQAEQINAAHASNVVRTRMMHVAQDECDILSKVAYYATQSRDKGDSLQGLLGDIRGNEVFQAKGGRLDPDIERVIILSFSPENRFSNPGTAAVTTYRQCMAYSINGDV